MKNSTKIVFLVPPDIFITKTYAPPLGLASLAAVLKSSGYEVEIIDALAERLSQKSFMNRVRKSDGDVFGMTCITDFRFTVFKTAKMIKSVFPDSKVVLGGPHVFSTDVQTLETVKDVDIIVRSEGEESIVEIADALKRGASLSGIRGITFRRGSRIIRNEDRPFIKDIDKLPMPARELLPFDRYNPTLEVTHNRKCTSVVFSRGCPYQCVFCANRRLWRSSFRKRSVDKVIDEMRMLVDDYNISAFDIWDDTFTMDKKWLKEVCNGMIREGMDTLWYCRGRVNNIDRETVLLMKKAGCRAVLLGVESGSQRVLDVIRKAITVEQAKRSIKTCIDNGVSVKTGFMVNHPTETLNDVRKTMRLIKYFRDISGGDSSKIKIIPGPTRIYPGTDIESMAKKSGKLPADFNWAKPYYNPKYLLWNSSPYLPLYEEIPLEKLTEFYIRESLKLGDWFTPAMLTFFNFRAILKNPRLSHMTLLSKNLLTLIAKFKPEHYRKSINEYSNYIRYRSG